MSTRGSVTVTRAKEDARRQAGTRLLKLIDQAPRPIQPARDVGGSGGRANRGGSKQPSPQPASEGVTAAVFAANLLVSAFLSRQDPGRAERVRGVMVQPGQRQDHVAQRQHGVEHVPLSRAVRRQSQPIGRAIRCA